MYVEVAQQSDTGRKRSHNEDYVASWEPNSPEEVNTIGRLYVVADGVGGATAGEVASRYAAEQILHGYFTSHDEYLEKRLANAIQHANREIYGYNQTNLEQREMGTTVVAALLRKKELVVANVGDSRAYLIQNSVIEQLTHDHNVVANMVRWGEISQEEASNHPMRSHLTRCLGSDPDVKVDLFRRQLQQNDTVILCSDGLTRYVADQEMAQLATSYPAKKAAHQLISLANQRGGADNISVIILRLTTQQKRTHWPFRSRSLPNPELDTTYSRIARKKKRRWWPF